jgi:predicted ester cyclase
MFDGAFPGLRVEVVQPLAAGDPVADHVAVRGTPRGACPARHGKGATMDDLEAVARRALALLDERRMDEWEATMAPDASFSAPGIALRGRAPIRQFVEGFQQAFPDIQHRIDRILVSGDTLIVEGRFTGTHSGVLRTPGGDVPPTGRRLEVPEVQLVSVVDGLAASLRTYFDRLEMLTQLGLLPAPAAR